MNARELAFRGDVVSWKRVGALRTGRLVTDDNTDGERAPSARSGMINLDPVPRLHVLEQGVLLVDMVTGEDRYLQHLKTVFTAALDGRDANFDAVTGVQRVMSAEPPKSEPGLPRLLKRLLGR